MKYKYENYESKERSYRQMNKAVAMKYRLIPPTRLNAENKYSHGEVLSLDVSTDISVSRQMDTMNTMKTMKTIKTMTDAVEFEVTLV